MKKKENCESRLKMYTEIKIFLDKFLINILVNMILLNSVLGRRDSTVIRALAFHQCGPGSIPGFYAICGLSLLVLYSAPRGFSPGTLIFPSPQKPTFDLICSDFN